MRTLTGTLLALALLFAGTSHANGNAQQKAAKDAKRYGAGSTVTRTKTKLGDDHLHRFHEQIEVKKADGSISTMQRWTGKREGMRYVSTIKDRKAADGTPLSHVEIARMIDTSGQHPYYRQSGSKQRGNEKRVARMGSFTLGAE